MKEENEDDTNQVTEDNEQVGFLERHYFQQLVKACKNTLTVDTDIEFCTNPKVKKYVERKRFIAIVENLTAYIDNETLLLDEYGLDISLVNESFSQAVNLAFKLHYSPFQVHYIELYFSLYYGDALPEELSLVNNVTKQTIRLPFKTAEDLYNLIEFIEGNA